MLQLRGLTKSFGSNEVLKGLDLRVEAGEICALIGPNGSGKSTLAFLIAGLLNPDLGDVEFGGTSLKSNQAAYKKMVARRLGFASQDVGLYDTLTAMQNLRFFAEICGVKPREVNTRVQAMIETFDLASFTHEKVKVLSGGQKRRLHAAIAFIHEPDFVILDEPTVGADIEARARLIDAIKGFAKNGVGILYTTHYLPEVESLEASIAILEGGRVSYRDSLQATLKNFARSRSTIVCESSAPEIEGWQKKENILSHYSNDAAHETANAVNLLYDRKIAIRSILTNPPSLENAYLQITGHELEGEGK